MDSPHPISSKVLKINLFGQVEKNNGQKDSKRKKLLKKEGTLLVLFSLHLLFFYIRLQLTHHSLVYFLFFCSLQKTKKTKQVETFKYVYTIKMLQQVSLLLAYMEI